MGKRVVSFTTRQKVKVTKERNEVRMRVVLMQVLSLLDLLS